MTRAPRVKAVKPVMAWVCVDNDGVIWPHLICDDKQSVEMDARFRGGDTRVIRVRITPVRKRRGK